ncbi:hypothetical protein BESB_037470 [Besnoitia besnoiti]|uniref:Transmembrane protein n=1 Tax=Besnoitia besnoiti TaxID=94643 RepID=A0A2A9MHA5_BESBE|nr:hypothetical protein BESB_037470 [Besnoitia besnoiti]PFH37289.1 hypothetical protein BESB_037470 [Besnoitia besnoiti]
MCSTCRVPMAKGPSFGGGLPRSAIFAVFGLILTCSRSPFFATCLPASHFFEDGPVLSASMSWKGDVRPVAVRQPVADSMTGRAAIDSYQRTSSIEVHDSPALHAAARLRILRLAPRDGFLPQSIPMQANPPLRQARGSRSASLSFLRLREREPDGETEESNLPDAAGASEASADATASEAEDSAPDGSLLFQTDSEHADAEAASGLMPEADLARELPLASEAASAQRKEAKDGEDAGGGARGPSSQAASDSPRESESSSDGSGEVEVVPKDRASQSDTAPPEAEVPQTTRSAESESTLTEGTEMTPAAAQLESSGANGEGAAVDGSLSALSESQGPVASDIAGEASGGPPLQGAAAGQDAPAETAEEIPQATEPQTQPPPLGPNLLAEREAAPGEPPVPFPQDVETGNAEASEFAVPGNMTVPLYREELARAVEAAQHSNRGRVPVLQLRWHSQESFVDSAAHLLDETGTPYFFVVAGEYTQTPVRRMGFFQTSSVTSLGPLQWPTPSGEGEDRRKCPFFLPRVNQLLDSSLNITDSSARTAAETDGGVEAGGGDTKASRGNLLLRWIPYGLTRVAEPGAEADSCCPQWRGRFIRTVHEYVAALQETMPERPLKTIDGREVIVVVNDRRPELELLLQRAMDFAPTGTPVIVTDTEAFEPGTILPRIKLKGPKGEKLHFVVFGVGRYGQLSLNAAFLDRAVLRVPRSADINAFVQRHSDGPLPAADAQTAEIRDRPGRPAAPKESTSDGDTSPSRDNFLILNPFNEFLMRFNYTEVDSVAGYAAQLTRELQHTPITFVYQNETRRVAVVLLTDFPEAESVFLGSLLKLNVVVQVTIAVAMIIGLLACLCMCRMMFLLKSR